MLNIEPDSPNALNNIGVCHSEMGDYEIALSYFGKACISNNDSDIIINAIITAVQAEKFLLMNYYCNKLEGMGSLDPKEYMNIAIYLMEKGHPHRALRYYDLYIQGGGKDKFMAFHGKGVCLAKLKSYDEALHFTRVLLSNKPAEKMGWELKGLIFDLNGQYAKAVDCYNIAYGFDKVSEC